ncbi:ATP-binding protein [Chryseobacterium sp. CT-SW4]|uniref:ATP-binding protein n=1 Tax=Chryseobacterium sp. SW-1 TaxID=3157343 RepID=UPI003B02E179
MDKGLLRFDIKTGMKNIIGRDLITDDFIAIYELVKNSYDAYADYVKITFGNNEIIIADNGKGMSKDDLENKWFAVAYSAKKDGTEDDDIKRNSHLSNLKSRRFYAGAKGVGRFSCDRLGNRLELITSKINANNTYKLNIDWEEFDKDSKESFNSIQIPFEEIKSNADFPQKSKHGTILRIKNLNSKWDEEKLVELRRSLEKLINPFSKENDFSIEIEAKEILTKKYSKVNGVIDNTILKILDLKTTQIELKLKNSLISTKILDRGNLIYHIEEPNEYKSVIDDLEINLYFLNRSAKINFSKLMDIEPVNYGNIFLFKNGFRVQPYGNIGDDSWRLDNRKQQGYNRFLGTRDLFGKVDIITERFDEFKEVSSRDGGLVESLGKKMLFEIFYDKAFKRLERYVVGVLWGEAFSRKNYFLDSNTAVKFRQELVNDKDKDTYEDAVGNLGSKIDFVNLIKSLSDDTDIKIIDYNKDFVNLVNEKLDIVQPKFILDLEKIAEKTNDEKLLNQVKLTEANVNKIIREKEEAQKREEEERKRRIEAEKKAEEERKKRENAERKQQEEELKRKNAELAAEKKEKERALAELAKIKAEQKVKEKETENIDLSDKLSIETKKNQYLNATRKTLSDDAEQLVHTIDLYVGNASTYVTELLDYDLGKEAQLKTYAIKNNVDKALKVSSNIIKSNFDYKHTKQRVNLPVYINEYLMDMYPLTQKKITVLIQNVFDKYLLLNPIDIDIILDNLISNSIKAKAKNVLIEFEKSEEKLVIFFFDDGQGVPEKLVKNPESIFQLGVRESTEKGSGIGMYDVFNRVANSNGKIEFIGNNQKLKGAAFKIII